MICVSLNSPFFLPVSHREEEESLRDKIRADHERALQEAKEKLRKSREELQAEIQTEKNKVMEDLKKKDPGPKPLPPVPMPKVVGVSDGEPSEPDVKEKRDKIREVRLTLALYGDGFFLALAIVMALKTNMFISERGK